MADNGVSSVAISIRDKFESLPTFPSQRCIYKAPDYLRKVNEECYRPLFVSIGPLYHRQQSLQSMQEYKIGLLRFFLEHSKNSRRSDLEHFIHVTRELEDEIRSSYEGEIMLSSNEFIEMVLLDASFIISLFMTYNEELVARENFPFDKKLVQHLNVITSDLFLEENQLPYFFIEHLFHLAFGTTYPDLSFLDLANTCVSKHFFSEDTGRKTEGISNVMHLVDLLRFFFLPTILRDPQATDTSELQAQHLKYCVTELSASGVTFKASRSKNLLDITFDVDKGVLEMPKIEVSDQTERLFRNIMLLEQSNYYFNSYLVDYVILLDKLINTPKDVELLVQNGILDNYLGSNEEVANLFNWIVKHVTYNQLSFYYSEVCKGLNEHAAARCNQWKAILKKEYFPHPWAYISVIYAIVLLILTLIQTIKSFK